MAYNPNKHHRRSIRLKGYDYSQAGLYFITICTQNRECLFGDIKNGKAILNDAGEMVKRWYYELDHKFKDIKCHAMVVMPNHFHCIIENVGADLCVYPNTDAHKNVPDECTVGADQRVCPNTDAHKNVPDERSIGCERQIRGEHVGSPLRDVVQWFKTMTTNNYIRGVKQNGWPRFNGKLWQRNYWEHIIRNTNEYQRITQYIVNNPKKWGNDALK